MSLADDLLNMSSNGVNSRLAIVETEPHIIIGDDRFITVPDELKRVAVQFDHRVETVTFDCPRYWDGYDMSKMKIYINYVRADGLLGMYLAENVFADQQLPNIMHFDWTLTRNVTGINGPIVFLVCVKRVDRDGNEEIHWNSEKCLDMYVSDGLEGDVIQDLYPDIFTQMLQKMDETVEEALSIKESAIKETTQIKNDAITETTKIKNQAITELTNIKNSTISEATKLKDQTISETTNIKNSAISELNKIKDNTKKVFDQSLAEARELVDETQSQLDETNELHNETLGWVKEVTKIATPEAMKNYTIEYYDDHPDAILEAVGEIYSIATEEDIDKILAGEFTAVPDSFEEEFSLATDGDIDAILAGDFVDVSEDITIVTTTDIDAIIKNTYVDIYEDDVEEEYHLAPLTDIDLILANQYIDDSNEGNYEEGYHLATNTNIDEIIGGSYIEEEKDELEIDKPGDNPGDDTDDETGDDTSIEITDEDIEDIIDDLFTT